MKRIFFILLFVGVNTCFGQKLDFRLAVGDRSATIYPFTHAFDGNFYPVFQTGIEYWYSVKNRFSFGQTAVFHYNYHSYLGNGIGVMTEATGCYSFRSPFFIQLNLGIGYLGEWPAVEDFRRDDNGDYIGVKPIFSMVMIPLSFLFGYEFQNKISVFALYQYAIQFPYNKTIGMLPTDNLMLGMKVNLFKKRGK